MAESEENSVLTLDVTTTPTIERNFTSSNKNITIIINTQKLMSSGADLQHYTDEYSTDLNIREVSKKYKKRYQVLLKHFKEWEPRRQKLLKILEASIHNLKRNSSLISVFRILTSLAGIFGTLNQRRDSPGNLFATSSMENVPYCNSIALMIEKCLSRKIIADIINALEEDQKSFIKLQQWFKQTEELDRTVKGFFPYGIDKDEVKKIHACYENLKDFQKIYVAAVLTNLKQDEKLFKDKEFLRRADCFAASEIGNVWFQKVLLEQDPCDVQIVHSKLLDAIQNVQRILSDQKSVDPEVFVELCRVFPSFIKMKVMLNAFTIISCVTNLLSGEKLTESITLENLLESSKTELQEIKSIVSHFTPFGWKNDPISEA